MIDDVVLGGDVDEKRRSRGSGDHSCGEESNIHGVASEASVEIEAIAASSTTSLADIISQVSSIGARCTNTSADRVASRTVRVGIAGNTFLRGAICEEIVSERTNSAVSASIAGSNIGCAIHASEGVAIDTVGAHSGIG